MIEMSPQQFLGILSSLMALGFFLGVVWVMFLHWAGIDL